MQRNKWSIFLCMVLLLGTGSLAWAQSVSEPFEPAGYGMEVELEYLNPTREHRWIDTVSMNLLINTKELSNPHLSFYYGGTLTRAWGESYRSNGKSYQAYRNSVFGIGPTALLRYTPIQRERFFLSVDASGSLIFYTEDFPVGGDFYNFMWRIGPKVSYQLNEHVWGNLSYKWMHVSNGQSKNNPGYDGKGWSMGLTYQF